MVLEKLKKGFSGVFGREQEQPEYIEIDLGKEVKKSKIVVKTFVLNTFEDVTPILNALRDGYTIAVIDISPLKAKQVIELKRAISKIKKTVDALEGSISGFRENIIIATPEFAEIYKSKTPVKQPTRSDDDFMRE